MSDRGEYRAIRRVLLDGPDFQRLPERARWVFVALKLNFGPAGIEVWYPAELVARISAQTGTSPAGVQDALMVLEREGWVQRESNVVWIKGQLAHDPHVKRADVKHRKMIQRHVEGLPRLAIVARYTLAHRDWFTSDGSPTGDPTEALLWAIEGPSKGHRSTEDETEYEPEDDSLGSSGDDPVVIPAGEYPPEFAACWLIYPRRTGGNSKREAFKAWKARLRAGVTVEVLHAGVARYLAYCEREQKTGSQFVMQAQTFFGPGERYLETWESPGAPTLTLPAPDRAGEAWESLVALIPAWQRREVTAEIHAALPEGVRRGLSKIGGFRVLAETPDAKRQWLRKDFVAAFNQVPSHAGAA